MSPLIAFFGILLGACLVAECVSLFVAGSSLVGGVLRMTREVLHGSKEVALPEGLRIAAINGLLAVGSELVVGTEDQWDGGSVKRFAISPTIAHAEVGAIMRVIRLTRSSMEFRRVAGMGHAKPTEERPGVPSSGE